MNHKVSFQNEIDSLISLFSKGHFKKALNVSLNLIESYPEESILLNIGGACYAGLSQHDSAINFYQKSISIKPDYSKAHFNLAITFQEIGSITEAIKSYSNAIKYDSRNAEAFNNLGNIYKDLSQNDEAIDCFLSAIEINPSYLEANYSLALTFHDQGMYEDAVNKYQKVVEEKPDFSEAWYNLGSVYKKINLNEAAITSFKKAVAVKPDFIDAYNELGNLYSDLSDLVALDYYEKAIALDTESAVLHFNIGNAHRKLSFIDNAIESYMQAISIDSKYFEALNNLGYLLKTRGQYEDAIKSFKDALIANPKYADAYNNLGITYYDIGLLDEAKSAYEKALKLNKNYAEAYANLARLFSQSKQYEDSILNFEIAIKLNPDLDFLHGGLLGTKMYISNWDNFSNDLSEIKNMIMEDKKIVDPFTFHSLADHPEFHLKVASQFFDKFIPQKITTKIPHYEGHKKIKIGYFSADFRNHPVSFLTAELFELHDRERFEIHAFSFGSDTNDEMNLRIKSGVDCFHDIRDMSHLDAVNFSRSLEIDIAIDLGGYTANSRTEIFAMSVAPIQASYIGFLGTMGTGYYDYIVADKTLIPEGNQKYYSEKIIHLPSFQVNDSTIEIPDKVFTRKELGLPDKGFVFCCFNNTYKIMPSTFDSWARILDQVEYSVMMLYVDNKIAKVNLAKEIEKRGVSAERLIFGERLPKSEYLSRYRAADLFLDTHPYNAGTTASDALRMGLPILTYTGDSFASRMCSSILSSIDLPELICLNQDQYELKAIDLANNPDKIKKINAKLSNNLLTSQLYDTKKFTKNIESAYIKIYERSQDGLDPEHIYI